MKSKSLFGKNNRKIKGMLFPVLFISLNAFVFPGPIHSPTWGFSLDLPEGYEYSDGDKKDKFSFENKDGAKFDISVYYAAPGKIAPHADVEALAMDIGAKLNNKGDVELFEYREKESALLKLSFTIPGSGAMSGWAFCTELGKNSGRAAQGTGSTKPLLLAMAYGPAGKDELQALHLSALDSLIPEEGDRFFPGPITEFSYPRQTRIELPVFGQGINALFFREDAEAAQALIDREFLVLTRYANAPGWMEAWKRFYRAVYRDSFDRLADIVFQVERKLNVPERENRDFADQVLHWVQSFEYERDHLGSDFINLVTAATEGRGDCDNRAMLWALILKQAGIPSAIMVSRHYSHAMGLAELPGAGAHFEVEGQKFLVAETTADVPIGLIGETVSDIEHWLGILFE
jgi:hypothetical protein